MLKTIFFLVFLFFPGISTFFAQTDSSGGYGTIKIAKQKDSTYIKAFARFSVYEEQRKDIAGSPFYIGYVNWIKSLTPLQNSNLIKITDPYPDKNSEAFNYTGYFRSHPITKNIKMRVREIDTVIFRISVNKKGTVRFEDVTTIEKLNDTMVVYTNLIKTRFKVDICHLKTQQAFKELAKNDWVPAKIEKLKRHPSKHKKKYITSKGYSQGYLTIIYSSSPFNESFPLDE